MGSLIQNTSTKGKIGMAVAALGVVLVAVMLMKMATSPSYSTIATGVDPAQTGKMTAALDTKGVKWKLVNNGTGIAVDSGQTASARVALAEQGLPQSGQPGFELFDKQKLGASNLQQQVTYQRALEGELDQTIGQVQGVTGAQVNLVLPQEQLFSDANSTAKASVLLDTGGSALDPNAVRGIAQLVSGGVQGLTLQNVSITDSNGQLLWPTADSLGSGPSASLKEAAQSRYDQQLGAQLQSLLDQTVGPGKGTVQVNADLNVDQTSKDALVYAKKGVPLTSHKQNELLKGGGGASGTAGAGANIPSYAGAGAGGGSNNYNNKVQDDTFGVSKTVSHTKVAPGTVNKLDVAVLVDKSIPPATVAQLQSALGAAAGITPKRGDAITVSQVAFAKQPAPTTPKTPLNPIGYAKYVLMGLALMAFLFFMMRHLKKREDETLMRKPTWLNEIEAPTSLAELEASTEGQIPVAVESPTKKGVEELADRAPDRVAQQVRIWMNEA
ncbi:MAG TPA: flagellar basal-body MS-ring/collar protein FliF [Thermoleophilaceae bacterium]|nr:flagellar basal-body MS-ring/collar protein FliF [Thermoleophilaceae bacterium]